MIHYICNRYRIRNKEKNDEWWKCKEGELHYKADVSIQLDGVDTTV
jgi:hypothetical protein